MEFKVVDGAAAPILSDWGDSTHDSLAAEPVSSCLELREYCTPFILEQWQWRTSRMRRRSPKNS